jgi:hypothetical protein
MKPVVMPHSNRIFKAPVTWDKEKHGECLDLPVSDYGGVLYSYHKPSWKERLLILFGRPIRLCIASSIQPPIALDCENK